MVKIVGLESTIEKIFEGQAVNLLLKLFESSNIKEKLNKLYSELEQSENSIVKEVVIFSLLKNISNYDLNFHEILDLFNADYIALKRNDIEFIPEIFEQGDDDNAINVRSSIISTSLMQNVIKIDDIIKVMKKAFISADKKIGRTYIELQKSMVSHSQFVFFTNTTGEREKLVLIESFYDDIRNPKFVPFQVKTVQGRYFVEKCYDDLLNGKNNANEAIEAITDATKAILMHYKHPENNLYYVFKVVRFYSKIFTIIKDNMKNRELSIYIEKGTVMSKHMEQYLSDNTSQHNDKVKNWRIELMDSIYEAKKLLK